MKSVLRNTVKVFLQMLPAGAPEKLYAALFRGLLGKVANPIIKLLIPQRVQLPEGVVVLNQKDPAVSGSLAFGVFEPYESALFRESVREGDTVVDVGANIGYYTVIAAYRTGDSGRVIAFEPAPENFTVLKKTVAENNFKNVSLEQMAVADREGSLTLNLYESNQGKHSLVKDASVAKGFNTSIKVKTTTLDAYLANNGLDHVDVIKMDIEGAESLALTGMPRALALARALFLEFTPASIRKAGHDPVQVLRDLQAEGFRLEVIHEVSQTREKVIDFEALVRSIPDSECVNLFCEK